ncbi:MAG: diguanylate cyclase [Pseudomonadota bacterium]
MRRRFLSLLLTMLAAAAAFVLPAPAFADESRSFEFAPSCHAASGDARVFRDMVAKSRWTCSASDWQADQPVAWLRFDADSWEGKATPEHFFSRIARHRAISFAALDKGGALRITGFSENEATPFARGPVFRHSIPEITDQTQALLVRIERPHSVPLLTEARLTDRPENAGWSQGEIMLLAFVVGMLVLPLFFDITFYLVLRERSIMLHALMVVAMMTYVLFASGLITVFATLPLALMAVMAPLSWAVGCGLSALFLASFLEEGAQSHLMRRATFATGVWSICVAGFFALQLHATQAFDDTLYFYTLIPLIVVMTAALTEAVMRGSRSARFIAFAWAPIILISLERLLRGLGFYVGPSELDQGMYLATALEVIMISLAIADRFFAIRRERDEALSEARMLELLSERDPLTGLMNRRAMEERFEGLIEDGFDTFALIDLDRFKDINDRFGHQTGDAALVACAKALRGDTTSRDAVTVRMGGEEFAVFLRGANALRRVEALRTAIPRRIAHDVSGLDRLVTASMGVIELPQSAGKVMTLAQFYERADKLLYEAKASGRNRMMYERLTYFADTPPLQTDGAKSEAA